MLRFRVEPKTAGRGVANIINGRGSTDFKGTRANEDLYDD